MDRDAPRRNVSAILCRPCYWSSNSLEAPEAALRVYGWWPVYDPQGVPNRRDGLGPGVDEAETASTLLDRAKFAAVIEDAFRYAAACQVYLWVVPPGTDVRIVERNLLYDFQPTGTDWGKGSSPGSRLKLCHRSPLWLTPEVRAQVRRDVLFV